jgi:peroxin-12
MLLLENYFLKKYGASFTENFYSMKRVFVKGSSNISGSAQRLRSLFFLVVIPYIEGKLSNYRDKIENIDPPLRSPFMNFFYKWYPIVSKILGIIGIGFLVLYAFGYVNIQTLPLFLAGARLDRLSDEDIKAFNSVPVHMEKGLVFVFVLQEPNEF